MKIKVSPSGDHEIFLVPETKRERQLLQEFVWLGFQPFGTVHSNEFKPLNFAAHFTARKLVTPLKTRAFTKTDLKAWRKDLKKRQSKYEPTSKKKGATL